MARTKQPKLAKLIDNTSLDDNTVIQIGEHTLSLGELRQMDSETEGASTTELEQQQRDLEQRENTLVAAQNNTMTFLQSVADSLGVPFDDFVNAASSGKTDGLKFKSKGKTPAASTDEEGLEGLDDSTKAAVIAARKVLAPEIAKLNSELTATKKALGIGISVSLEQYYDDQWEKLEGQVPKGKDNKPLVKLDQKSLLKYATDNKLLDARGRADMRKAFKEMTSEARTQQMILEAEERGAKRKEDEIRASAMTRPGPQQRPPHLTAPPTVKEGNRERVKTFDEVLADARADEEIWKTSLSGGFGSA